MNITRGLRTVGRFYSVRGAGAEQWAGTLMRRIITLRLPPKHSD